MKKLFTLILALVMAAAMAAPALAAGWPAKPETPANFEDITLDLIALETYENVSILGALYEKLDKMYPVVKGTDVHGVAIVTLPKLANIDAATKLRLDKNFLVLELGISNVNVTAFNSYKFADGKAQLDSAAPAGVIAELNATGETLVSFGLADVSATVANTYLFQLYGSAITGERPSVISAKVGFYNPWVEDPEEGVDGNFFWGDGEFMVEFRNASSATYTIRRDSDDDGAYDDGVVQFAVVNTTKGKIDDKKAMLIGEGTALTHAITKTYTANPAFMPIGSTDILVSGEEFTALMGVYNAIFGELGFDYEEADYMMKWHFNYYFGTIQEYAAPDLVWPSGYVAELVVEEPTLDPPQTGDSTTAIGYVMIAVALLAAAVVTAKRVRA